MHPTLSWSSYKTHPRGYNKNGEFHESCIYFPCVGCGIKSVLVLPHPYRLHVGIALLVGAIAIAAYVYWEDMVALLCCPVRVLKGMFIESSCGNDHRSGIPLYIVISVVNFVLQADVAEGPTIILQPMGRACTNE